MKISWKTKTQFKSSLNSTIIIAAELTKMTVALTNHRFGHYKCFIFMTWRSTIAHSFIRIKMYNEWNLKIWMEKSRYSICMSDEDKVLFDSPLILCKTQNIEQDITYYVSICFRTQVHWFNYNIQIWKSLVKLLFIS